MKTFETWRFKGVRFLAFDNGGASHVIDENGGNYGAWMDLKTFRSHQANESEEALPIQGQVGVRIKFFAHALNQNRLPIDRGDDGRK